MKTSKIIFLISMLVVACSLLQSPILAIEEAMPLQPIRVESNPEDAAIDFETYQRNIDDIYHIAMMSSPNMDYGLNSVIVNLNRKLASRPDDVESIIGLGHVYRILGQPSEANRFYQKALQLDSENFHLNIFTAMTNAKEQRFEAALGQLDQAILQNPLDIYPRIARGRILMVLRRHADAVENFQQILEIQPENREAAFAMSLAYQQIGETDKAFAVLSDLQEKDPSDLYVKYHLGALSFTDDKPDQTIKYWEALFSDGVRDIQFLFNLSIAYIEAGEGEKAEKILEHLSFLFPREIDVELLMAEAYRQMDRLDEAERRYRLVLAENPRFLSAYMGLADVLELQNRHEEAEEALQQAERFAVELEALEAQEKRLKESKKNFLELFDPA